MTKRFYEKLKVKLSLFKPNEIAQKLDEVNKRLLRIEKLLIKHHEDDML